MSAAQKPGACQALTSTGWRCRARRDLQPVQYHGSGELYCGDNAYPTWVQVYLCPQHREKTRGR